MGTRARSMNHLVCDNKVAESQRTNEQTQQLQSTIGCGSKSQLRANCFVSGLLHGEKIRRTPHHRAGKRKKTKSTCSNPHSRISSAPTMHEHIVKCDSTATRYAPVELEHDGGAAALPWPSKPMCLPTTPGMAFVMQVKSPPGKPRLGGEL